jgi:hypothetical protein
MRSGAFTNPLPDGPDAFSSLVADKHREYCRKARRTRTNAALRLASQFADSEGRLELITVGIIAMGWSGAGSLVGRLAGYRPERYIAGIAYKPGQYEPLGMDTIELSDQAMSSPQLIIANGGDNIKGTERPYGYFKKYFLRWFTGVAFGCEPSTEWYLVQRWLCRKKSEKIGALRLVDHP